MKTWASCGSWTRGWRRSASWRWPITPSSRGSSSKQCLTMMLFTKNKSDLQHFWQTQDSPGHGWGIHGGPGQALVCTLCQEWTKFFSQGGSCNNESADVCGGGDSKQRWCCSASVSVLESTYISEHLRLSKVGLVLNPISFGWQQFINPILFWEKFVETLAAQIFYQKFNLIFSVAEQAEGASWSGEGHPSKVRSNHDWMNLNMLCNCASYMTIDNAWLLVLQLLCYCANNAWLQRSEQASHGGTEKTVWFWSEKMNFFWIGLVLVRRIGFGVRR